MMFLSFARNSSCVPLSCGLGLGFIPAPQNKIARFRHSPCRNLAISPHKNQQQSHGKMRFYSIFNGGLKHLYGKGTWPRSNGNHGDEALCAYANYGEVAGVFIGDEKEIAVRIESA